ncbi:type 2 isopentenyl-diphosphate Delta-isomerase [Gardnerella greenwoodii]|uniref:Isopentenyl-diphosphate delta-isomerase n=1 Tax=Gardnerella greenwoodii 00703Dmash TaxID=698960 RepID=I4M8Z0_9BIFI|nr:type 2 isopentenyl-diphosphate Delta-isomerase [Gardnerella greenwoodii]EIK85680.1 isopentenyl pyrophosphate isomerase [Gardnerella greenwoodii 00703Dmash]
MTQVQASAPGKLYIAGEYAVVDGSAAIVAAVNRYVTVKVDDENLPDDLRCDLRELATENLLALVPESRKYYGVIASEKENYKPIFWTRAYDGSIEIPDDEKYAYVFAAMRVIDSYACECSAPNMDRKRYNLHISSELDDAKSGRKYGLGSSAAITVATVRALCKWYGLKPDMSTICKLSLIASSMVKKSGSGGDVAASSCGGWILYRAYDRDWLESELGLIKSGESNFSKLLRKKWPRLEFKRINVPKTLKLLVGWTGSPASSAQLVSSVESSVESSVSSEIAHPFTYQDFCNQSEVCVQKLAQSLEKSSLKESELNNISACFAQNRELLQKLSALTGTLIETPKLTRFIEDANFAGIPAKTSGAGGGDCAIALTTIYEKNRVESMKSAWENHGIMPLNIEVAEAPDDGENSETCAVQAAETCAAKTQETCAVKAPENQPSQTIQNRKDAHLALADAQYNPRANSGFDSVRFMPNALPQLALDEVDSSVHVFAKEASRADGTSATADGTPASADATSASTSILTPSFLWRSPLYINAMTGGSSNAQKINAQLARVAAKTGVAIASGSLSAALQNNALSATFSVIRSENPHGFVMANVSAGTSQSDAMRAVEMLQANALQVHLNAAQELVMPEGDRDFRNWLKNIEQIVRSCEAQHVPVVVKETGCGMTARDVLRLRNIGVRAVDVSGRGGTNFVAIENARRSRGGYDYLADWGLTTVESLIDIQKCDALKADPVEIFASGGVRTPLDVVRALALGASAVGVAGEFLHTLMHEGEDALLQQILDWQEQIHVIMALLGCKSVADLRDNTEFVHSDCLGK